jgi:hypothetical protein
MMTVDKLSFGCSFFNHVMHNPSLKKVRHGDGEIIGASTHSRLKFACWYRLVDTEREGTTGGRVVSWKRDDS